MFSSRVPGDRRPNRLASAVRAARVTGGGLIDLTVTNPTRCGFDYPADILMSLAKPAGRDYVAAPFGLETAREAIAADYARRGLKIDPRRIVLTSSTSEAYSVLFKLLCEPAGSVALVPAPSYPLFEHLTRLDGVLAVPYRLEYHGRWWVDLESVEAGLVVPNARVVLAVSPNNPTGSALAKHEADELLRRCARAGAALILDEVFADYSLTDRMIDPLTSIDSSDALAFRLGGLSKSAGLPQVKLGWVVVSGPAPLVEEALDRLELICDTYLSVSTPVQVAAADLIARGAAVRDQVVARIRANQETLRSLGAGAPSVDVLAADGGWSAVLRVPATRSEEDIVLNLLDEAGVLVHPGFFFDFPREAYLVVSLLPPPDLFRAGVQRMLERVQ
ncbi:pyridoxal phosphate-dependent aminotransferase [soil metagenome]